MFVLEVPFASAFLLNVSCFLQRLVSNICEGLLSCKTNTKQYEHFFAHTMLPVIFDLNRIKVYLVAKKSPTKSMLFNDFGH
ncbi:hypothetical protein CWC03_09865 [Pseudoalteromonas sp. S2755]|nr:hypothetical protein CWC03_09865 [Pseudoalteromonas sp. S2755]